MDQKYKQQEQSLGNNRNHFLLRVLGDPRICILAEKMEPAYYGTTLDPATGSYVTDPSLPTLAGFTPAEREAQEAALTYCYNLLLQNSSWELLKAGLGGMLRLRCKEQWGMEQLLLQPLNSGLSIAPITPFWGSAIS